FFSSRRRHTSFSRDWSSDVCSSDLALCLAGLVAGACGGSLSANANAKASSDSGADADFDADANASGNAGWDTVDASQSEADTMEIGRASCREGGWRAERAAPAR